MLYSSYENLRARFLLPEYLSIFVSVTIWISRFFITASARSSNLFLIEFILMWDITIRFKLIIHISFSFVLKSSFFITVVIETGSRTLLVLELFKVPAEEKVWASMLGNTSELDEHKGYSDSRILFFLIQQHSSFIQIFLMTFAKFFANWVIPKKFKWSLLIPNCQLVIVVLSTISIFKWRRWFVSWLTVNAPFPSWDLNVGVEISTLKSGTCSLTNFLKFSN